MKTIEELESIRDKALNKLHMANDVCTTALSAAFKYDDHNSSSYYDWAQGEAWDANNDFEHAEAKYQAALKESKK